MTNKTALGHIDCPTCGTAKGMRITQDKNGEPFGYCEAECNQQMRIGGSPSRVKKFLARYPWAAGQVVQKTVTVTEPKTEAAPVPQPVTAPAPVPTKKRNGLDDALSILGVK